MQEEQQDPLVEAQEELSKVRSLTEARGWPWFSGIAQIRVQNILDGMCQVQPAEITLDTVLSWVFQMGEIAALKRQIDLPLVQQKVLKEEIEELMKSEGKDNE